LTSGKALARTQSAETMSKVVAERLVAQLKASGFLSKAATLQLTHEFLSLMLGVRRPGVTEALHALRQQGLISYGRGQITVKNRKGRSSSTASTTLRPTHKKPRKSGARLGQCIRNCGEGFMRIKIVTTGENM
jgi:DNA-binding FadR family transcriptional regulator